MKDRIFIAFFLLAIGGWMATGCSDENKNQAQPENAIVFEGESTPAPTLGSEGGTSSLSFSASSDWTAEVTAVTRSLDWISVSPTSGSAGNITLQISAQPNTGYDERNAAILLSCGSIQKTVTVTQKQQDALIVNSNKVEMEASEGSFSIELQANVGVTYEIEPEAREWLSPATASRGLNTSVLNFQVKKNLDTAPRQAVITFHGNDLTEYVTVYQAGGSPAIVLSQKEYTVPSRGDTIKAELQSNVSYQIQMPEADWITETAARNVSAYTHYFVIAPNSGEEPREADILFRNQENGIQDTLHIYQVPQPFIAVAKTDYQVSFKESTLDFELQTNTEVEITTSADWITQVAPRTRGIVKMDLSFKIAENPNPEERYGNITIRDKLNERIQDIYIRQDPYGKELVSTTYDMYIAWEVNGFIQDEAGNIFFNPSLSDPADWYEASFLPVCQRIRNYANGTQEASSWNDYGFIFSGADITDAYFIVDNSSNELASMPDNAVFVDFTREETPEMTFQDNALTKNYYGSMRDVMGWDPQNTRTTELRNCYTRYIKGDKIDQDTPFLGEYDLYSLTGPNRVWFTEEQLSKLEAYFGGEVKLSDVVNLDAGQLTEILGTKGWDNPYLGLPDGTYSFAYHHSIAVGIEGARIPQWDGDTRQLAYGLQFTQSDGFFIEQEADNGPMMLTYPTNIGAEDYRTEVEIISEDARKTVAVLKLILTQDFKYENTRNGFPQIDNEGVQFDDYYPAFTFRTVLYDTLVSYKYPANAPFKIRSHYFYHDNGGDVPIEISPDQLQMVYEDTEGELKFEYEITSDVDWIHPVDEYNDMSRAFNRKYDGTDCYIQNWTYTNDPNYSLYPRVGHVTFKMKGSDYQETIRVVQRGQVYTEIDQDSYHFDYQGGTFTIDGRTTWPEKVIVRWSADWIEKATESRGLQDISLGPLRILENTSTEPRTATLTVYDGKYLNSEVAHITVTQDGCPAVAARSLSSGRPSFWNNWLRQALPVWPDYKRK